MYDKNFDNPIYVRNIIGDKVDFYLSVLRKADEEYHNGTDVKASKLTDKEYDLLRELIIVYNQL